MSGLTYRRPVRYYHFHLAQKDRFKRTINTTVVAPSDWDKRLSNTFLQEKGKVVLEGKTGSIRYCLYEHDSGSPLIQLSMHKRLDSTFLTEISDDSAEPVDFKLMDNDSSKYLANSTAVTLGIMDERLVAAVSPGSRDSAPGITALQQLINYAIPLNESGWTWIPHGVMMKSDRELLEQSSGALGFSGEFLSEETLPVNDDVVARSLEAMQDTVGTDVRLRLFCEVVDKNSREGTAKMLNLIKNLKFSTGKKPKVTVLDESGAQHVLTLARHAFASEIYLEPNDLIGANFSSLLNLTMENFEQERVRVEPIVKRFIPTVKGAIWQGGQTESSDDGDSSTLF